MPKKEQIFAGGAGLLLIAALVVMVVFIILWNNERNKSCPKIIINKGEEMNGCREDGCKDFCKNETTYGNCGELTCVSDVLKIEPCNMAKYTGCMQMCGNTGDSYKNGNYPTDCHEYCSSKYPIIKTSTG